MNQDRNNNRKSDGNRRSFNNQRNSGFRKSNSSFGNREMHKTKCDECKKDCEVPFKPTEGKPVFCRECYAKKKKF